MKILNKSKKEQSIRITDRYNHTYTIYVPAGKSTDLEPYQVSADVTEMLKSGILENVTSSPSVENKKAVDVKTVKVEEINGEKVTVECACGIPTEGSEVENQKPEVETEVINEEKKEEVPTVETKVADTSKEGTFVCEKCGAEFASKKGLTMHMNKLHKEEAE